MSSASISDAAMMRKAVRVSADILIRLCGSGTF